MNKRGIALALMACTVMAAACGVRVTPQLRKQAADAQLAVGTGSGASSNTGGQATPGTITGGGTATGPTGGTNPSANPQAPNGSTSGPTGVSGQPTTPGAGTTPTGGVTQTTLAGGNGGATDVGVAADSILLGNVSDLSGPVPGLFQGAVTGTLAYLNYTNSQGGVYGRTLKLQVSDSQTQCAQTQNDYTEMVGKVFAFVGGFGLYDDCASEILGKHTDIPYISYALSPQAVTLPNNFSADPIPPTGYPTGGFTYFATKFGTAVQHVGSIYPNIPSASTSWHGMAGAAQSVGWKIAYSRAIGATENNFTTDIVAMQQAGVKVVWSSSLNSTDAAILVQEAESQNWHPIFILPPAYASNFFTLIGGTAPAEGIWGMQLFSLFFNASDAKNIPEVALYQQWMHSTNANQPLDLFSMYGWAHGSMFVKALKAAGPKATRAAVMAALRSAGPFNANGMVGTSNPGTKKPTTCYVIWQIQHGQFNRVDTPAADFRCDGTFHNG